MSDETFELAASFPETSYADWLAAAEKALKRGDVEKALATRTYEGFALKPLYTRERDGGAADPAGLPGLAPFTRGADAAGRTVSGWDIRQTVTHPDLAHANATLREDLDNSVHSLSLRLDRAALCGDANGVAEGGLPLHSTACWQALLANVPAAALALEAGAGFLPAAALLAAAGGPAPGSLPAPGSRLGADPLGTLAAHGALPQGLEQALADMADLAAHAAQHWPHVAAVTVDASAYDAAGASESQTLAAAMATGVAYLRAMVDAGMGVDDACAQIVFRLPLGPDQFFAIAKLRAARKLWARIAEVAGASEPARAARIDAVTANRNLAERDPYTNLLRTTLAGFAAAVGGADSITIAPYDAALGPVSDDFARRVARNTQLLLKEESNLHRVMDPGGGSWFLEDLTAKLAQSSWALFQEIERAGGMAEALTGGMVAGQVEATWAERQKNLARRRDPLTGVSEFPNIAEDLPDVPEPDLAAIRTDLAARLSSAAVTLPAAGRGERTAAAIRAAQGGATLASLLAALGGNATSIAPLPRRRFGEAFEAMRDESDRRAKRDGRRPAVFLANLGALATYTPRATFAKNAFEAGGLQALDQGGFTDAAALTDAFKASGARLAVLCSSDKRYGEQAEEMARALKAAGCAWLALAGVPGEAREAYEAAGVDDFIAMGGDLLGTLQQAWAALD
ncbi:MAG: methylmalonyl-CoA mutase [Alphaproteobacteria bacterium]|nr:methylmalonyl-CoA mutase [Alphaproteobacteria bacterium]